MLAVSYIHVAKMKTAVFLALLVAAAVAAARASDVVQLTSTNFDSIVAAEPALMVEFFAPCTCRIRVCMSV
jgi:ABC-type thiamine transport system substrate-binding protein